MKKHTLTVVYLLIIVIITVGCSKTHGIRIGFSYGSDSHLRVAVKSEQTEFEIDDMVLDFYMGWEIKPWGNDEDLQIGFALYFVHDTDQGYLYQKLVDGVNDYTNLTKGHFASIVMYDNFRTENFKIESSFWGGAKFKYYEQHRIPNKIITSYPEAKRGEIRVVLAQILYNKESGLYFMLCSGSIKIEYKILAENKISFY